LTTPAEVLQLLFDIGAVVDLWIPILLASLALVTTAVLVNPIAIVMLGYKFVIKATGFGFSMVKRLVGIFK
jgi:hypothetical protein